MTLFYSQRFEAQTTIQTTTMFVFRPLHPMNRTRWINGWQVAHLLIPLLRANGEQQRVCYLPLDCALSHSSYQKRLDNL